MESGNTKVVDPSSYDWDDAELIRMYDDGMKEIRQKIHGTDAKASSGSVFQDHVPQKKKAIEWQTGDYCQAIFSEDRQQYEAMIKAINDDETVVVEFVGYGNEEEIALSDLAPSKGAGARHEQIERSQKDWKVGDYCWALYYEDNEWYEGKIVKIVDDDTVTVKFLGYDNKENIPTCDLKPSQRLSLKSKHKYHRDSSIDNCSEGNFSLSSHCSSMTGSYSSHMSSGDQKRLVPRSSRRVPFEADESFIPHSHNRRHMHHHRLPSVPPNSYLPRRASLPPFPTDDDDDSLSALLLSWYMAGYHTGYHMGMRSRSRH